MDFRFAFFMMLACVSIDLFSQSIERSVISSLGSSSVSVDGQVLSYTIGEPIGSAYTSDPDFILVQGFEQPQWHKLVNIPFVDYGTFTMYPNPVQTELFIEWSDIKEHDNIEVLIYNTVGQMLDKQALSQTTKLDFTNYAQGVYYITLRNSHDQKTKTIAVEKL